MRLAAAALALLLAACRADGTEPAPSASVAAPVATRAPEPPAAVQPVRAAALDRARALERAAERAHEASAGRQLPAAAQAALELRRAWRRIEPLARVLAPLSASQIDPEHDEPDEILTRTGLRVLGDALAAESVDWALAEQASRTMLNAARLAVRELSTATWDARRVTVALSRAVFEWGRRLDGSRAESGDELAIDVVAGGRALLEWSELLRRSAHAVDPAAAARLRSAMRGLEQWLAAQQAEPAGKLRALMLSGRLGAEIRASAVALGSRAPQPAFLPHRPTHRDAWREPVHVATFPKLIGAPPRPDRIALGAELFFDTRLSAGGKLACASCHRVEHALGAGPLRPLAANGAPVTRDVPALWNVAYDPMHFWDGRASTLADQVRVAVENDMGENWDDVVRRLSTDADLAARFRRAFAGGLTADSVREAIGEFERTLVDDSTPLDRFVRGDENAMTSEMLRGFDVYFGKSRCSRCHRLPLTSGTLPPRFVEAEAAAIGVPTAVGTRTLDPDRGRGAATRNAREDHAFKVPTLRNLSRTGPYFHNGSFRTLEQVVDFYEKGSGPGLGIQLDTFDPDAAAFEITPAERKALLVFLKDALRSAN